MLSIGATPDLGHKAGLQWLLGPEADIKLRLHYRVGELSGAYHFP